MLCLGPTPPLSRRVGAHKASRTSSPEHPVLMRENYPGDTVRAVYTGTAGLGGPQMFNNWLRKRNTRRLGFQSLSTSVV